jgi:YceI-like domain
MQQKLETSKMKIRKLLACSLFMMLAAGVSVPAAEMTKYYAKSGSKMRMEGTSNIHDWQVEATIIGGFFEVASNFPSEPGQPATPGKMEAHAEPFVMVRSLKSLEKDGKPYSDKMDDVMYEKLKSQENPKIQFHLEEFTLKEPAKSKDAPYVCEAKGQLAVAGVTNQITMPVNILPLGDKKLKISGTTTIKMTDFKIEPPAPKIAMGMIKTGDEVKLIFDWMVMQRPAPATAAK